VKNACCWCHKREGVLESTQGLLCKACAGVARQIEPWENPNDEGYSAKYKKGKPCWERGCNEPAGSFWGDWCFKHNVARMKRIDASFKDIMESFNKQG